MTTPQGQSANPLRQLQALGQSIWLDHIGRNLVVSGQLKRLIEEDGLRGLTSNPAIFAAAITSGHDYDDDIRALALENAGSNEVYESLSQRDVQTAADAFRPLYDATDGLDGYVSLEVNPHLAHDAGGTAQEARRLWRALDRPNVLIKVPATEEGIPVIRQLIEDGINVNATLLFGLSRYRQVAEAYVAGIEARAKRGLAVRHVASVASFFLSRIDSLVDSLLEPRLAAGGSKVDAAHAVSGHVAIASAKMARQLSREVFGGDRFKEQVARGARAQRLLWASTGTKNPSYSDVKYVEALIGPETVNTLPLKTLAAYRDHGAPEARLDVGYAESARLLNRLPHLGIDIEIVTRRLEDEGIAKFVLPFDTLLRTLSRKLLDYRVEARAGI